MAGLKAVYAAADELSALAALDIQAHRRYAVDKATSVGAAAALKI